VVVVVPTAMAREPWVVLELEAREVEQMPEPTVQLTRVPVVVVVTRSPEATEDQVLSLFDTPPPQTGQSI
jgi:hypothetical protein